MLLESGGEVRFQVRPIEGIDPLVATPGKVEKLILDGQQRLTSLSQVLLLTNPVKTTDDKKRRIERYHYINIDTALAGPEHYEDAVFGVEADRKIKTNFGRDVKLDLSSPQMEYENFCFPCNQILNSDQWEEGLLNAVDQDKFRRYMKFRQNILAEFRNYDIPIIELKKNNRKEAVCLVFEKVNTGGVPLSVFELLTATYAADGAAGVNLRKEWFGEPNGKSEGTVQRLAKQRLLRGIEATEFLQGLSLLHTFDCRKKDLAQGKVGKQATGVSAKREAVLALPLAAYKQWKEPLEKGFWQAAKFLRKESFFSSNDLPYRTQLVPLAAVLALMGDRWMEQRVYERLSRWFWCGVLGELYGGAVESRMALDVPELVAWLEGADTEPTTVRDASFQPGRLDTLRSRLSAAYKGINVLIQRNGAQDFFWKATIRDLDETDWEECKLDIHHIFPRAWCEKQPTPILPRRYNSILNKTPISYKANRMIGGRPPSEYLKQLQTHKNVKLDDASMDRILATHYIETTRLRANDFEGFIEQRRTALISLITQVMGKPVVTTGEAVAEDDLDEEDVTPSPVLPVSLNDGSASIQTNSTVVGPQKGKSARAAAEGITAGDGGSGKKVRGKTKYDEELGQLKKEALSKRNPVEVMRLYLNVPPNEQGQTPAQRDEEGDKDRATLIDGTLKPMVEAYIGGKVPFEEFKSKVDRINRRQNRWGFRGIKGQLFFNQVVKVAGDAAECDKEIKAAIAVPPSEDVARTRINAFAGYVRRIGDAHVKAGRSKRGRPKPSSIPFFLSYFWQIQDQRTWPIYYTNAVSTLSALGLWQPNDDLAESYIGFKRLYEELAQKFSQASRKPFDLYGVEHVFWFIGEHPFEH
jgi:hypothetical protein